MNITIISVIFAVIVGITKLLTYLLGDKRRIRKLREEIKYYEAELKKALAKNDTVVISCISSKLEQLRLELKGYTDRK